ncbi:amino acid adenylation domain-containing protein, partial [Paenibacillus mucilaginosus]
ADRLARVLAGHGLRREARVGILMHRSPRMVECILAVWKAGGAYIPVDPEYPAARTAGMLADAEAAVLLTESAHLSEELRRELGCTVLELDRLEERSAPEETAASLPHDPDALAYVIYTSGSTGRPKGAMVEHRGMMNHLLAKIEELQITERSVVAQNASHCFDISVWQFFSALTQGGTTVIYPNDVILEPEAFLGQVMGDGVTILETVPSYLAVLLDRLEAERPSLTSLAYLVATGEALKRNVVQRWFRLYPEIPVVNAYGPTEASDDITHYIMDRTPDMESIPVGRPVRGFRIYIVDAYGQPCPLGVKGEIWVSGIGVGRGYLNDPERTALAFGEDPFVPEPGRRLYRTGDLGSWREGGVIEFFGRRDHQVKVRGYRIELGEIDNKLADHPEVTEAVVTALTNGAGESRLCAYYTGTQAPEPAELAAYLAGSLPHYMIPSHFVRLESMPVTANGKIDRKALPLPEETDGTQPGFTPPATEVERKLAEVWSALLGRKIGIDDHFFHAGGDSIKAIQVSARLLAAGLQVEMKQLFLHPTIRTLSPLVRAVERRADQTPVTGEVPMLPMQRWFLEQDFTDRHHFNQSVLLYRRDGLDGTLLERVLNLLVTHHDALRSSYPVRGRSTYQRVRGLNESLYTLQVIDIVVEEETAGRILSVTQTIQESMCLEEGPLLKLAWFRTPEGDHLFFTAHHLVIDGISWRILLEDFMQLYGQGDQGKTLELPPKTHSVRDWAEAQIRYAEQGSDGELDYWRSMEEAQPAPLPRSAQETEAGVPAGDGTAAAGTAQLRITLSVEETAALTAEVHQAYNTEMNDVLLTALGSSLSEWTGGDRFGVWLEGHGREAFPAAEGLNISRTVGWFTSLYPLVLPAGSGEPAGTRLKKVKEALRQVPNKGIGYGILKYMTEGSLTGSGSWNARRPEIGFNYLGDLDGTADGGSFAFSKYETGREVSPRLERRYPLDINGWIRDGRLTLVIDYDPAEFAAEAAAGWAGRFETQLKQLIEHCRQKGERELTPSDISSNRIPLHELEQVYRLIGPGRGIQDVYTLTPLQQGLMFQRMYDPASQAYFQQLTLTLQGAPEAELLQRSLDHLAGRYDMFRTVFLFSSLEQPVQVVLRESTLEPLTVLDLTALPEGARQAAFAEFADRERKRGFDWSRSTPMRAALVKLEPQRYELVWSFHHILMDGWCLGIVLQEWFETYALLREDQLPVAEPAPAYGRYAAWMEQRSGQDAAAYWSAYLGGFEMQTGLPKAGFRSRAEQELRQKERIFVIDEQRTSKLQELARAEGVTLNTVFQTLWGILLQKYNNTPDVLFGAVVSGRPPEIEGIERMVGLFINTIPVRIRTGDGDSFAGVLKSAALDALNAREHDTYPLYEIQAQSGLQQHLLDHIVAFENYPLEQEADTIGETFNLGYRITGAGVFEQTHYPLSVTVAPRADLTVKLSFREGVYEERILVCLPGHLERLIDLVTENPHIPVRELEIVTEREERLLADWQGQGGIGSAEQASRRLIHHLFEETAAGHVEAPAVLLGGEKLTYAALQARAAAMAAALKARGVGRHTLVAVLAERSAEMVVSLLAILQAGGAYLPIDPEYPADRIQYILDDSGTGFLLTEKELPDSLRFAGCLLRIDGGLIGHGDVEPSGDTSGEANPDGFAEGDPDDTAYVIYTSGTTGRPKGVPVPHRGVTNLLETFRQEYGVGPEDRMLQFASLSFDASVWEIWTALLSGAALVLAPKEVLHHPVRLERLFGEQGITVALLPPAYALQLPIPRLASLRLLVTGGSEAPAEQVDEWSRHLTYVNAYGPTEASIITTLWRPQEGGARTAASPVPIGRPVAGMQVHLLDRDLNRVPPGVPGELCIAGTGLADGYLHRPELTAEKFVSRPDVPGGRIYRTGDLARWLPDGQLEYLGRIDHQVKIRGYRIELGEIESVLLQHPGVREAVVVDRRDEGGLLSLCAYWSGHPGEVPDTAELRAHLAASLPDYMIPAAFVAMDKLPLTPNGKIDRRALPEPDSRAGSAPYAAPEKESERLLVRLWSEVLGREAEAVGIDDSFFDLGGHSLKAAQLASRIHRENGTELPVRAVFERPTIRELAALLEDSAKGTYVPVPRAAPQETYRASFAQKRLFILHEMDKEQTSYNLPTVLKMEGRLDAQRLESAFRELIRRHEALRTSFELSGGEPVQRVHAEVPFELEQAEVPSGAGANAPKEAVKAFIRPFDLGTAPLLRAGLIRCGEETLLLFDIHHIIADGMSVQMIIRELQVLYAGAGLPEPGRQYKDYSQWQGSRSEQERIRSQRRYWLERFSGELPVLELPLDRPRPAVQDAEGALFTAAGTEELTRRISALAAKSGTTVYMVLQAAYGILLSKYSGQEDLVVGTPVAGRSAPELQEVVGMFVGTLALRMAPEGGKRVMELLSEVRRDSLEAFEHQDYPFEELVDELRLERSLSRSPLFDVMFAYQNMGGGMEDREFELEGSTFAPYEMEERAAQFDLTLEASDTPEGLRFTWGYRMSLFDRETVERMAGHYLEVLGQMTAEPERTVGSICLLTEAERAAMLG